MDDLYCSKMRIFEDRLKVSTSHLMDEIESLKNSVPFSDDELCYIDSQKNFIMGAVRCIIYFYSEKMDNLEDSEK